jgi:hypothetical protein
VIVERTGFVSSLVEHCPNLRPFMGLSKSAAPEAGKSAGVIARALRKPRGPKTGTVARYAESDRKYFKRLAALAAGGQSLSAAARRLAPKLRGGGTDESKATRLRKLFVRETAESRNSLQLAPTRSN